MDPQLQSSRVSDSPFECVSVSDAGPFLAVGFMLFSVGVVAAGTWGVRMSERAVLDVVEELYDAAVGGTPWSHVCRGMASVVEARSASLIVGDFASGRADLFHHGDFPPEAVAAYYAHYRAVDLWTTRAAQAAASFARGPLRASISGRLVPDTEFVRSEFYQDFGRPLGLRYVVGSVVPLGEAGVAALGLHRPEGVEPFEGEHARLVEVLLPHLRRAMQLRHRFQGVSSTASPSLAALDALTVGILILDGDLRVHLANAAAEAMDHQGFFRMRRLPEAGERRIIHMEVLHRDDQAALGRLVMDTAAGRSAGGIAPLRGADRTIIATILVSPLPSRLTGTPGTAGRVGGRALAIVRELPVSPRAPSGELLRSLFGLTAAEAEVACALVGGATKASVAARRRSSLSTVRTQVRAILEKTGAVNLRDLERLLARLDGS